MTAKSTNRFLLEIESAIAKANREALKARVGTLTRSRMESLAAEVAEIRADYIHAAFNAEWSEKGLQASRLHEKRVLFSEAVAAFEALERAVERGYVDIAE